MLLVIILLSVEKSIHSFDLNLHEIMEVPPVFPEAEAAKKYARNLKKAMIII